VSPGSWVIRRIGPDEGPLLADVRLAALLDSPTAFGSTYASESNYTEADWSERARMGALGISRVTFFAEVDGEGPPGVPGVVGLIGGYRPDETSRSVELVSMWTSPAARRSGVGRALAHEVLSWAASLGVQRVTLWVTRGNDPAVQFYRSLGFSLTGDAQPLPSDPGHDELAMELTLPE
jgi:ribosomal protein S18 acetylase RimI-like enzyme